jgi:hypothetical protein
MNATATIPQKHQSNLLKNEAFSNFIFQEKK